MCPAASSRWCPTPEQLMILEEMYRRGIRTPNATQIQQVTAHLAFYGRIEGKNVFYWFQNHKARDRQKLRKKLARQLHLQQHETQSQSQSQQHQHVMYQPYYNINNHHHHNNNQYHQHCQCQYCCAFSHHQLSSSSGSSLACYSNNPSTVSLPSQGINGGEAQNKVLTMKEYHSNINDNAWKIHNNNIINPEGRDNPMIMSSLYDRDWMTMIMMDMGPYLPSSSSSCCNMITIPRPPLKTLELFPISSSSNFKDDTKPQ